METHQIKETDSVPARLLRINQWIRAQKATPAIPTLCCAMVDGNAMGFVLTRYLDCLPGNGNVQEIKHDQELRSRFAKAGDLEVQSSTWQFTVIPNY